MDRIEAELVAAFANQHDGGVPMPPPEAPQPAKLEPLTEAEVLNLWSPEPSRPVLGKNKVLYFARAAIAAYERKNGIGK